MSFSKGVLQPLTLRTSERTKISHNCHLSKPQNRNPTISNQTNFKMGFILFECLNHPFIEHLKKLLVKQTFESGLGKVLVTLSSILLSSPSSLMRDSCSQLRNTGFRKCPLGTELSQETSRRTNLSIISWLDNRN